MNTNIDTCNWQYYGIFGFIIENNIVFLDNSIKCLPENETNEQQEENCMNQNTWSINAAWCAIVWRQAEWAKKAIRQTVSSAISKDEKQQSKCDRNHPFHAWSDAWQIRTRFSAWFVIIADFDRWTWARWWSSSWTRTWGFAIVIWH